MMKSPGSASPQIGFIGLGVMGSAMAKNLASEQPLLVWNRTASSSERLAISGAEVAPSSAEVFRRCSIVFLMVTDEVATDDILRFDGSIDFHDRIIVQMSTVSPEHSRMLSDRVRAAGGRYIEAPVSGSRQPAIDGTLLSMVAGDDHDIDQVEPLLRVMCSKVFRSGPTPNALRMKLAVNTFLITLVTGLAESFHFAEQHQLDVDLLEKILGEGPMASSVSKAKAAKLANQDWSVHASIPDVLKNSRLVAAEARRVQNVSPLIDVCVELFAETEALGHTNDDMAAVFTAFQDRTRVVRKSPPPQ